MLCRGYLGVQWALIAQRSKMRLGGKKGKLSFEEWQILNPGGTFKDYTAKLPFKKWQALNPGGTFKEYYAGSVFEAIAGKRPHATLGPVTKDGAPERGDAVADMLISMGVSKSDLVVDYGCGTLRVGKKLIEYLEPSRFVGLEIDHRILDSGLAMLPPELVKQKTPILDVINSEVLDRITSMRPNWIFSKGVLHHVPPGDLGEFFGNIYHLTYPETRIVIWARLSELATEQASKRTWYHNIEGVISVARNIGFDAEVSKDPKLRRIIRLQRWQQV